MLLIPDLSVIYLSINIPLCLCGGVPARGITDAALSLPNSRDNLSATVCSRLWDSLNGTERTGIHYRCPFLLAERHDGIHVELCSYQHCFSCNWILELLSTNLNLLRLVLHRFTARVNFRLIDEESVPSILFFT